MPFRYVKSEGGEPIMPEVSIVVRVFILLTYSNLGHHTHRSQGMVDLIRKDSDKAIDDMF